MCGIAGIIRFDDGPVERGDVMRMARAQSHRGPDGEGAWTDGPVGLSHRRLAVIDLTSAAAQPMRAPGGDVLVYNGEVYNFLELRRDLERLGYVFLSNSD